MWPDSLTVTVTNTRAHAVLVREATNCQYSSDQMKDKTLQIQSQYILYRSKDEVFITFGFFGSSCKYLLRHWHHPSIN